MQFFADFTRVAIIRPKIHEERYHYRKEYHSLNVQNVSGDIAFKLIMLLHMHTKKLV